MFARAVRSCYLDTIPGSPWDMQSLVGGLFHPRSTGIWVFLGDDFMSSFRVRCNAGFDSGYMQASVYGGYLDEFPTFSYVKVWTSDPEVDILVVASPEEHKKLYSH